MKINHPFSFHSFIRIIRHTTKNILNWLLNGNGIFITLVLGIFVNLLTGYVEEMTLKQRYLELLQLEITNHQIEAYSIKDKYETTGQITIIRPISNDVYAAGLENGYILSLEPGMISQLNAYYTVTVPSYNNLISFFYDITDQYSKQYHACLIDSIVYEEMTCDDQMELRDNAVSIYSESLTQVAAELDRNSSEILGEFRPAQHRLQSPLLRLLMGSESLEVLK